MNRLFSLVRPLLLLAAVVWLQGCSGMRVIDSEVSSFPRWTASAGGATGAPGTTYRFERLPSQERLGPADAQDPLEASAEQVLARYGLVHKPEAALLVVQVGLVRVVQPAGYGSPYGGLYGGPFGGPFGMPGVSVGAGTAGSFIGLSFPVMRSDPPAYLYEISFVMRDSRNNAVVYETRARHSGPWGDAAVWPALMEAALTGFPNPVAGQRRVKVEIPR